MPQRGRVWKNHPMAQNRHIRDYRLVETIDERGRIRTDYEYIGNDYYYLRGAEAVIRDRRTARIVCAAAWAAFVGGLLPNSGGMRTLWVSMPYIFTAVPLGVLTETLITAVPEKEPLQHRQADRLENRFPPASLAAAALPLISLVGEGIDLLLARPLNGGDAVLSLCAAMMAVCAAFVFSRRKRFGVRKG